jgi:autotransporter-associated beta strand protein
LPGTLELAGSSSNTATGNFFVNQGTMVLNKTGSAVAIAEVGGQTASILYVGNSYGGNGADMLEFGSAAGSDQIAAGARVEVRASGKIDLNGKTEQLTTTSSWVLHLYSSYSTAAVVADGTLTIDNTMQTIRSDFTNTYSPWSPAAEVKANITMTSGGGVVLDAPDGVTRYDLIVSGTVAGTGTVVKNQSGSLWMTNTANSFTGNIYLNSGVLVVSNPAQLGRTTNRIYFNNMDGNLQSAALRAQDGALTLSNPITLQGNSLYGAILGREAVTLNGAITVAAAAGGTFRLRTADYGLVTINGNISFANSNSTLSIDNQLSSTVEINGVISDAGSDGLGGNYNNLQKDGYGTLILKAANTYEGSTTVNLGVLRLTNSASLGQATNPLSYTNIGLGGVVELYGDGLVIPEQFRVTGSGFGPWTGTAAMQTGAIRLADAAPGVSEQVTLSGNINLGANSWFGVAGAEDTLVVTGTVSSSEVQTLTVTSGSYTLTLVPLATVTPAQNVTTISLNASSSAADVKAALEGALVTSGGTVLSYISGMGGSVEVIKDPTRSVYTIYFRDNLDNANYALMTVNAGAQAAVAAMNDGGFYGLYKVGKGTLELGGSTSNTYGGGTGVNEGTLVLNKVGSNTYAIGKGNLTIGDEGGGDNADVVQIKAGAGTNQIPDYSTVFVASSGLFDLAAPR